MYSCGDGATKAEICLAAFGEVCMARVAGAAAPTPELLESLKSDFANEPFVLPSDRIAAAFELTDAAVDLLLLLAAADRDHRLWAIARSIHQDPLRIGIDCAVATALLCRPVPRLVDAAAELRRHGLATTGLPGDRRLQAYQPYVPLFALGRVVQSLCGRDELDEALCAVVAPDEPPPLIDQLVMSTAVVDTARSVLSANDARSPVLMLHGCEGIGKRSLVLALGREAGRRVIVVRGHELPQALPDFADVSDALVREAKLSDAVVMIDDADAIADAERRRLLAAALARVRRPIALASTGGEIRCAPRTRSIVRVELTVLPEQGRQTLWERDLGASMISEELAQVAARYPISPGLISRASRASIVLAGDAPVSFAHVRRAVSSELAECFRGIGQRVQKHESWNDLVLPDETRDAVKELLSRVRHRKRVLEEWGFGDKLVKGLGVSALFSGDPGTGKTMVAALVAEELGLELYQIDLSTLVSKYIGETEKNLARAFDAAESGHAILLFDEADSLFGKRTEVKSSVDRYANMEVNYLLQRVEHFHGVAILTTNVISSMDEAFMRRLAVHIRFELPDEDQRERLWQRMFPDATPRTDDLDFSVLADRYEFSGGHIRNAVLRAAYLAADENVSLSMQHLRRAADLEAQQMGRVVS